jgi:hypothetical protein
MTITVAAKRQLLSTVQMWLGKVALLNGKVQRSHAQTQRFLALDGEARLRQAATTETESCLLECMRELFGADGSVLWSEIRMMTLLDVHVMTLALEHVYQGVTHLLPTLSDEARNAADRFGDTWKRVREVRNGLEHEEQYLAGQGQRPGLVDAAWTPPAVGVARHTQVNAAGLVAISALGRWYHVADTIAAARELMVHIAAEAAVVGQITPDSQ